MIEIVRWSSLFQSDQDCKASMSNGASWLVGRLVGEWVKIRAAMIHRRNQLR